MNQHAPIANIMTTELFKLNASEGLIKAKEMFDKKKVRHLPIVSNGKLVGIMSLTDLMRLSFASNFGTDQDSADMAIFDMLSVEQVMKHHPKTVTSTQSIKEVAEMLTKEEFHALPVVDDDKLVGIVTTTDVIKYLLQ